MQARWQRLEFDGVFERYVGCCALPSDCVAARRQRIRAPWRCSGSDARNLSHDVPDLLVEANQKKRLNLGRRIFARINIRRTRGGRGRHGGCAGKPRASVGGQLAPAVGDATPLRPCRKLTRTSRASPQAICDICNRHASTAISSHVCYLVRKY